MFGFAPKPPVGEKAQAWIEASMLRLCDLFGQEAMTNAPVVLPTPEFFPEGWDGTEQCVERLLLRVCDRMHVDPDRLALHFITTDAQEDLRNSLPYWRENSSSAAGLYSAPAEQEKILIAVKLTRRSDPVAVIATLAHELAHVRLLSDKGLPRDAEDMEPLTDLMTVFCGFGVFNANSAARFQQYDDGVKQGWSFQQLGYLSEQMWGYALAYYAFLRHEKSPAWAKSLNINVGAYFRQSAKYLAHQRRY